MTVSRNAHAQIQTCNSFALLQERWMSAQGFSPGWAV